MNPTAMNILFVDDDEVMAQSVEMALRANGHVCEIAGLGERAVALCKTNDYDIAVLDVGLPDMDGYDVVRRLKSAGVETPVLLQTGRNDPDFPANAQSLGVEAFLTKPFSIAELLDRMEDVLAPPKTPATAAPLPTDHAPPPAPPGAESTAANGSASAAGPTSGEVAGKGATERRRHERKTIVEAAVIADRESHIPCVIINLSESGAGIRLSNPDRDCSESFTLQALNGPARACTQRWRKGAMIGVEFS